MNTLVTVGFVYYAVGSKAIQEAVQSVKSLRYHMPAAPVSVFTSEPDRFINLGVDTYNAPAAYSKTDRISIILKTPYGYTLFVDSDTLFVADCSEIFCLLHDNELLLSISNLTVPSPDDMPADFPFYNSGVIGYRQTESVVGLMRTWEKYMDERLKNDPSALDEPVCKKPYKKTGIDVGLLEEKYNYRPRTAKDTQLTDVKIVHCHGDLSDLANEMPSDASTIIKLLPKIKS